MEIDDNNEEIEIISSANEILNLHPSRKILIYSLHALLDQFEAHLDNVIKKYKIMTMTLLFATGAAIGFSFSSELKDLPINKLIMVGAISLMGVIGITAIWYLDTHVFQKFWGAFFVEEVKMEKEHPFLVDIGDVTVSLDMVRTQLFGERNFYIFLNCILIIIAGASFSFLAHHLYIKIIVLICSVIAIFCTVKFMFQASKRLHKTIENLLP